MHLKSSPQEQTRQILDSIRQIVRALRVSSRAAEKQLGLSGAQLFVLHKLKGSSALSINELAELTLTHQSSVSVVVSKLATAGLVTRSPSKKDARRIEISLTNAGRDLLKTTSETTQEQLVAGLGKLPSQKRKILASLLQEVLTLAKLDQEPASMFFENEEKP
jgi:DNA-binding MarR family transcriptional regulator